MLCCIGCEKAKIEDVTHLDKWPDKKACALAPDGDQVHEHLEYKLDQNIFKKQSLLTGRLK